MAAGGWRDEVRALVHEHAPGAVLLAAYLASAPLSVWAMGFEASVIRVSLVSTVSVVLGVVILVPIFVAHLFAALWRARQVEEGAIGLAVRDFRERYLGLRALGGLAIVYFALLPFARIFSSYKQLVHRVSPFPWDRAWTELDRVLHLGWHPWEWLHPVLGYAAVTVALDRLYMVWFLMLAGFQLGMAWSPRRALRMQFLLTSLVVWIGLGTVLAMILSSSDPCYYAFTVGEPDPYEPLMAYLRDVHETHTLFAIANEDGLWEAHVAGEWKQFGGVAGMPSLHVAVAVQLALLGWRLGKGWGVALTAYAVAIGLGSVHLGWHWAVDGYLSLILVPIIWVGMGHFVEWWGLRDPPVP